MYRPLHACRVEIFGLRCLAHAAGMERAVNRGRESLVALAMSAVGGQLQARRRPARRGTTFLIAGLESAALLALVGFCLFALSETPRPSAVIVEFDVPP